MEQSKLEVSSFEIGIRVVMYLPLVASNIGI
jgi:hypothetical protein